MAEPINTFDSELISRAKYHNHVVTLLSRKQLPVTTWFAARMSVDISAKLCKDNLRFTNGGLSRSVLTSVNSVPFTIGQYAWLSGFHSVHSGRFELLNVTSSQYVLCRVMLCRHSEINASTEFRELPNFNPIKCNHYFYFFIFFTFL